MEPDTLRSMQVAAYMGAHELRCSTYTDKESFKILILSFLRTVVLLSCCFFVSLESDD